MQDWELYRKRYKLCMFSTREEYNKYQNIAHKRIREERIVLGVCTTCNGNPEDGRTQCSDCLEVNRSRVRKHRKREK